MTLSTTLNTELSSIPSDISELVRSIHARPGKLVLAVTGAGTQSIFWLFSEPGTSRTVLDVHVPYSTAALDAFTQHQADQHVSSEEALLMAHRALGIAQQHVPGQDGDAYALLAGISCTAAIVTDRERRGENRCHVAFATSDGRRTVFSLVMEKGERDRAGEEELVSRIILNAVAEAKLVQAQLELPLVESEQLRVRHD